MDIEFLRMFKPDFNAGKWLFTLFSQKSLNECTISRKQCIVEKQVVHEFCRFFYDLHFKKLCDSKKKLFDPQKCKKMHLLTLAPSNFVTVSFRAMLPETKIVENLIVLIFCSIKFSVRPTV